MHVKSRPTMITCISTKPLFALTGSISFLHLSPSSATFTNNARFLIFVVPFITLVTIWATISHLTLVTHWSNKVSFAGASSICFNIYCTTTPAITFWKVRKNWNYLNKGNFIFKPLQSPLLSMWYPLSQTSHWSPVYPTLQPCKLNSTAIAIAIIIKIITAIMVMILHFFVILGILAREGAQSWLSMVQCNRR